MLKHAFVIAAHSNFEQLNLLIQSLSFGDVYLHIDKKNEALYEQVCFAYKANNNIFVLKERYSVNWSGFSQVLATLQLLKEVYRSKKKYDYIHFISGQDLLLMTPIELDNFLISNGLDKQYLEVLPIGSLSWRLRCYTFFRENPKNRTFIYRVMDNLIRAPQILLVHRCNFKGFECYKGSSWFSITQDCLEFILHYIHENRYCERFKFTACPDEHFFQILLMNSEYQDKVIASNFRYVVFEGLNPSPNILNENDYNLFMNGKYMFARKFDIHLNKSVVNHVLSHVQGGNG